MANDEDIATILQKFLDVEDNLLDEISSELAAIQHRSIESSQQKILKKVELHSYAEELIEKEVVTYREELYLFSRKIAESEMENYIITPSHVLKAKQVLWKRSKKYNLFDGFLALGSALLGASLPHLFELVERGSEPNVLLISGGMLGAFLLGMGFIGKAKED